MLSRLYMLFKYVTAVADMYLDCCFILIASACGTWHAYAALVCFCVGVLTFQWLSGVISAYYMGGPIYGSWTAYFYPLDVWLSNARQLESGDEVRANPAAIRMQNTLIAAARSLCEDMPQAYIQYLFT